MSILIEIKPCFMAQALFSLINIHHLEPISKSNTLRGFQRLDSPVAFDQSHSSVLPFRVSQLLKDVMQ
ncbi:hypothetical protein [Limnohabitans sp. 15K]|jgi:hypothetical protein|uniref:hypothetical protein n=1 Tax=Limnohabitans sp. 15K TaxID=1100706 RepID=UPI00117A976E|nr:hypothetical protein [Limnohabitans sp. 15K]